MIYSMSDLKPGHYSAIRFLQCNTLSYSHVYMFSSPYRAFSRDVTTAILVFQNKETAAILVSQTSPFGVELYFYAKIVFCLSIPIWRLVT